MLTPGLHARPLADRRYLLQIPPKPTGPLVVVFHGAGATAEWMHDELRWGPFADAQGWVSVFPEGTPLDPSQPPRFVQNPQVWNDHSGQGISARATADDVGFFRALLDEVTALAPADPQRVYVTGFSNGAALTFLLATQCADRIAAMAPVAALCRVPAPRLSRPVPTLFIVGREDPLVPLEGGAVRSLWTGAVEQKRPVRDMLADWAAAALGDERLLETVIVDGLGHHWPGGRGRLKPRIAGPAGGTFDANAALAAFFERHRL